MILVEQTRLLRRATAKIVTDEYLDLHALAITAFIFTVLGILGVASVADLASIVLALLALLAISQVRSRRSIASIARSQKVEPLAVFLKRFPQDLIERRAAAADVLLIGTSMSRTVQGAARTDMRRALQNGRRVLVPVLDPTDDALVRAASSASGRPADAERLKRRILGTLDELADLQRSTSRRLEVRVAPFAPPFRTPRFQLAEPTANTTAI